MILTAWIKQNISVLGNVWMILCFPLTGRGNGRVFLMFLNGGFFICLFLNVKLQIPDFRFGEFCWYSLFLYIERY